MLSRLYKFKNAHYLPDVKKGECQVIVDVDNDVISILHIGGPKPKVYELISALIVDDLVRDSIVYYQENFEDKGKYMLSKIYNQKLGVDEFHIIKKEGVMTTKTYIMAVNHYGKIEDESIKLNIRTLIEFADYIKLNNATKQILQGCANVEISGIDDLLKEPTKFNLL